jgi:hypothetical protein
MVGNRTVRDGMAANWMTWDPGSKTGRPSLTLGVSLKGSGVDGSHELGDREVHRLCVVPPGTRDVRQSHHRVLVAQVNAVHVARAVSAEQVEPRMQGECITPGRHGLQCLIGRSELNKVSGLQPAPAEPPGLAQELAPRLGQTHAERLFGLPKNLRWDCRAPLRTLDALVDHAVTLQPVSPGSPPALTSSCDFRTGQCRDSALAESFFRLIKGELTSALCLPFALWACQQTWLTGEDLVHRLRARPDHRAQFAAVDDLGRARTRMPG